MIEDIAEHQPHIVFNGGETVHVLPVALIRAYANGSIFPDANGVQLLAKILLDNLE